MKIKILFGSLLLLMLVFASPASAAGKWGLDIAAGRANYDVSANNNIYVIVEGAVSVFLGLVGFIFFGLFTMAGIRWMTARGNEEFVTKAKDTMSSAIWGLIITMSAYALTTFIFSALNK